MFLFVFFFFKQKTAYEMRISDWSSDVCSSDLLQDYGLMVRRGTIVDATIIDAPSSTKNAQGARDPEMHQTKKGNNYFFGMKAQLGVDLHTGLVNSVVGTAANVAAVKQVDGLLHGEEELVLGDAGYQGGGKGEDTQGG